MESLKINQESESDHQHISEFKTENIRNYDELKTEKSNSGSYRVKRKFEELNGVPAVQKSKRVKISDYFSNINDSKEGKVKADKINEEQKKILEKIKKEPEDYKNFSSIQKLSKNVKKDPDENFLFLPFEQPKMPKPKPKREILRMNVKSTRFTMFSEFQCKICLKYFARRESLDKHIECHYKPESFQCYKCEKIFRQKLKSKPENHQCEKQKFCQFCEKFISTRDFNRHLKRLHSNKLNVNWIFCDICGEHFKSRLAIRKHFLKNSCKFKKSFECDFCGKSFSKKPDINSHMMKHMETKVKCKICNAKMKPHSLLHHLKLSHKFNEVQCDICGKKFQNLDRIRCHTKFHNKKFECKICNLKFARECKLKEHMEFHEGSEKLKCKICGYQSRAIGDLRKHEKTHDRNREKRLKCPRCPYYQTDKQDHLRCHLKSHKLQDDNLRKWPKAIQCKKCIRVFKNDILYKRHLKNVHDNPKTIDCNVCEFKTKNKRDLKNHKQVEHGLELKN